jgi:hypothetical protein
LSGPCARGGGAFAGGRGRPAGRRARGKTSTRPPSPPADQPANQSLPNRRPRRCVKVIADHLSLGVKTGLPYIWHSKASDPFVNLRKEYKGIFWQEEIIPFFQQVKLDSVKHADVFACYEELAEQLRRGLGHLDPYFDRLADAMLTWIACWRQLNPPKEGADGAAAANGHGKAHA